MQHISIDCGPFRHNIKVTTQTGDQEMFDRIRKSLVRRRTIDEIRRLDHHLLRDIGLDGQAGTPDRVLLMTRGPFDRYTR